MLEAFIVSLREGVEAALLVAIVVSFLAREGRLRFAGAVWGGLVAAIGASAAGAWALSRAAVSEEKLEGVLYLVAAVFVVSMVVWMWRNARTLSGEIRGALARIVSGENARRIRWGLFLFTFVMVVREGIETVLFLSALSLSTGGLLAGIGATAGLALAAVFGVLFVRGSMSIDLARFFRVTGIVLLVFALQMVLNAYHELSEAGWVPAGPRSMALVGPLVKHEFFFLAALLMLPLLLLLVPGRRVEPAISPAEPPEGGAAAARLALAARRRRENARRAAALVGIAILVATGVGYVYGQTSLELSAAVAVAPGSGGEVRLPLAPLLDGHLHRFVVPIAGVPVRFIAIATGDERRVAAAFDACLLCGAEGYVEKGAEILCRHCSSAVYAPSIGSEGGCNPVPLASRIERDELVIPGPALAAGADIFRAR